MLAQNLEDILSFWQEESAASGYSRERVKGTAFEKLCQAFLTHDPVQKMLYEPPMTWVEWASMKGISAQDIGIDLVAKLRGQEGYCAIQCKFHAKGRSLQKKEIDSFLAASGKKYFACRVIIDTTGKEWSPQALETIRNQDPPVIRIGLHDLKESPIDWSRYVETHTFLPRVEPSKTPYPHQREAIQGVLDGLAEKGSRGKLIMACGTGKTYTSLRIAEEFSKKMGGGTLHHL